MNIVCVKCGAGVAYGLASLTNQTVIVCSGCGAGLRVALQAFDVPAAPSRPQSASSSARTRIVVGVEGEATREMIRDLLCGAGFEVIEATSGREIVAQVSQAPPSLVLVDVNLTDMMGHQVCETIRSLPACGSIKIILVAAIHNKARYRREPGNLFGADDFIERHQIEGDLLGKVERLCAAGPRGPGSSAPLPVSSGTPAVEPSGQGARLAAVPEIGNPTTGRTEPAPQPVAQKTAPAPARPAAPVPVPSQAVPPPRPVAVPAKPAGPAAPTVSGVPSPAPPPVSERSSPPIAAVPQAVAEPASNSQVPSGAVSKPTDPGQEAALRLARIIISDIALYNAKKVDESVLQGTFFDVLRQEISEGRRLYEERRPNDLSRAVDLFQQTLDQFVATRKQLLQRNNQAAA